MGVITTGAVGLTRITDAEGGGLAGSWGMTKLEGSGGTPSFQASAGSTDKFIQGTSAQEWTTNKTRTQLIYTLSSGGFDFTPGSTGGGATKVPDGNIYVGGIMMADGALLTKQNGGVQIAAVDSSGNIGRWNVDGSDTYDGRPMKWVICPNLPSTTGENTGTFDPGNVVGFGIVYDVGTTTSRFINSIIDAIEVGHGLTINGTTTTVWDDLLAADEGTQNNKYGILRSDNGIIYCKGQISFGDGSTASVLTAKSSKIVFEDITYYDGSSEVSCFASGFYKLIANGIAGDSMTWGTKVGAGDTAVGSEGLNISSAGPAVTIDFDTHGMDSVDVYGTTLENLGPINLNSAAATDEFVGNIVSACGQLDPGLAHIRTTTFISHAGNGAVKFNGSDLKNCSMLNNSNAFEFEASTEITLFDVTFSGNTYDGNNTSGAAKTINNNGSNGASFNPGGSSISWISPDITLTIKGWIAGGYLVIYDDDSADPQELGTELQRNNSISADEAFNYTGAKAGDDIVIIHYANGYKLLQDTVTLGANSADYTLKPIVESN